LFQHFINPLFRHQPILFRITTDKAAFFSNVVRLLLYQVKAFAVAIGFDRQFGFLLCGGCWSRFLFSSFRFFLRLSCAFWGGFGFSTLRRRSFLGSRFLFHSLFGGLFRL